MKQEDYQIKYSLTKFVPQSHHHLLHRSGGAAQIPGCEAISKGSCADQRFALPGTQSVGHSESAGQNRYLRQMAGQSAAFHPSGRAANDHRRRAADAA